MKIEQWNINRVKPYENNPRINDDAVDAVAASIREFGFKVPIVVDCEGVIVAGHTRLKAAIKLGMETVPVVVAADLTPEQIRAYRIADNKTAELAEWNYDLLPIELTQLGEAGFDLQLLGFDADELAMLLDPGVKDGLTQQKYSNGTIPFIFFRLVVTSSSFRVVIQIGEHILRSHLELPHGRQPRRHHPPERPGPSKSFG